MLDCGRADRIIRTDAKISTMTTATKSIVFLFMISLINTNVKSYFNFEKLAYLVGILWLQIR